MTARIPQRDADQRPIVDKTVSQLFAMTDEEVVETFSIIARRADKGSKRAELIQKWSS